VYADVFGAQRGPRRRQAHADRYNPSQGVLRAG
jgi:hypothetical protein